MAGNIAGNVVTRSGRVSKTPIKELNQEFVMGRAVIKKFRNKEKEQTYDKKANANKK